jgi:hypothetical protein
MEEKTSQNESKSQNVFEKKRDRELTWLKINQSQNVHDK